MLRNSQNFSKMSEIFIPELMELDSYWQKAVEDAICDTLKGEARLYHALKNRKKINKKMEKLGLMPSHMGFSGRSNIGKSDKKKGSKETVDWNNDSRTTAGDKDLVWDTFSRLSSKSGKESTPEMRKELPFLGKGSMEKMKKSQNNFCGEPMGVEERSRSVSSSSGDEEGYQNRRTDKEEEKKDNEGKRVEWIHVREDNLFEDSDSEVVSNDGTKEVVDQNGFWKRSTLRDKNYFINTNIRPSALFYKHIKKYGGGYEPEVNFDSHRPPVVRKGHEGNFDRNAMRRSSKTKENLEKKMILALAKRQLVYDKLKLAETKRRKGTFKIKKSQAKIAIQSRKGRKASSAFINFYLEVYRELCNKCPISVISREAAARWWGMNSKQKLAYDVKKRKM